MDMQNSHQHQRIHTTNRKRIHIRHGTRRTKTIQKTQITISFSISINHSKPLLTSLRSHQKNNKLKKARAKQPAKLEPLKINGAETIIPKALAKTYHKLYAKVEEEARKEDG